MPGLFITFEGIEGVGKSTLQAAIAQALQAQGKDVLVTREPGGTTLGERLRQVILSPEHESVTPITELLVMFAVRAQHVAERIQPALASGAIVLCDRFSDTSFAYQGGGRHLPVAWIEALVTMTHQHVQPQLTFWLDLPVDQALARANKRSAADRIEQEQIDFFQRARDCYKARAAEEPARIIRLDAALTLEALVQQALSFIDLYKQK